VPAEARVVPLAAYGAPPRHREGSRVTRALVAVGLVIGVTASAALSAWLIGRGVVAVAGNQQAPWILGRAAGVTSYLLLLALVALGLLLSHPWRARVTWPSTATRIRLHVSLAVFTLAFLVLHVVVLATDSYAGVGWRGTLVPMGASYRPLPVTLGVVGAYAGLLAGLTAALAGRVTARVWWPIHKIAAVSLVLVWVHAVLAGSDTRLLLGLYLVTGAAVAVLALSRYAARTPADRVEELTAGRGTR
jgi:predicted ferric reductase